VIPIKHFLIIAETEERMKYWKTRILEALGSNAGVIVQMIPELEMIIGPQPPVTELGANENQNRLNYCFQKFVGVFAQKNHPLVIFLDDLQVFNAMKHSNSVSGLILALLI
jgi:predicted ATPase